MGFAGHCVWGDHYVGGIGVADDGTAVVARAYESGIIGGRREDVEPVDTVGTLYRHLLLWLDPRIRYEEGEH